MSEKTYYHKCTHSNYDKLVKDLIQYGACEVNIGGGDDVWPHDVGERTWGYFTSKQKEESGATEIRLVSYDKSTECARYKLLTRKTIKSPSLRPLTRSEMVKGLRVKIHEKSQFFGQSSRVGTVGHETETGWWRVEFDGGYGNSYHPHDLCLEGFANNKQALSLLKKD